MIRNYGKHIKVAYSESEILMLRAAISLGCNRKDLQDIADLRGRTFENVQAAAYKLRDADREAARIAQFRSSHFRPVKSAKPVVDESAIPWPTPAQLMSGSTRVRTYNGRTT
jgi:hypothetical protein